MRRTPARFLRPWAACLLLVGVAGLAVGARTSPDRLLRQQLRLVASAAVARSVALGLEVRDPYAPVVESSCNCSGDWDFRCDDPEHPYYRRVRQDPRLETLFRLPPHRLETWAAYADFLRDRFRNGHPDNESALRRERGYELLEMLDDADGGSSFLCGDISKMFVQLVQAAGGFARVVALLDHAGSGHVVAEAWVEEAQRWVVFDADYDVHFTDASGAPLGALELRRVHREGRYHEVIAHRGTSRNALYEPIFHVYLLQHFESVAVSRRADWLSSPVPRWHPLRHPIRTLSAVQSSPGGFPGFSVRDVLDDPGALDFRPCRSREAGTPVKIVRESVK